MARVRRATPPDDALHEKYARAGGYTDCYVAEIAHPVTHAEYVEAFYTTWLFKLERIVLALLVARPSNDGEARELARGARAAFAAWCVEDRTEDQLLMCDFQNKTRSWFMVTPAEPNPGTRLYFGTAIAPVTDHETGEKRLSGGFRALLGFHQLYSRALLSAALSRLETGGRRSRSSAASGRAG
jgi:hypothetical protein